MDKKDLMMVVEVKNISARGNNAEVKQDKNGDWIVYEVQKKEKEGRIKWYSITAKRSQRVTVTLHSDSSYLL